MTNKRKRHSAEFKAKVALEALRGALTMAQLASKHGIHHTMVSDWKRPAMEGLTAVFADRPAAQERAKPSEAEAEKPGQTHEASYLLSSFAMKALSQAATLRLPFRLALSEVSARSRSSALART